MSNREKLMAKIAKLKALAECPTGNENETAVAAAAMTKLMIENNILECELSIQIEDEDPLVVEELFPGQKNVSNWEKILLNNLARANSCDVIQHQNQGRGWTHKIYGHEGNVQTVNYIFKFCLNEIERHTNFFTWKTGHTDKSNRTSFKMGMASGIGKQVREAKEAVFSGPQTPGLTLYKSKEEQVKDFINSKCRNIKQATAIQVKNRDIYNAGRQVGENLAIVSGGKALNGAKKAISGR